MLDFVREDAKRLERTLGQEDRARIEEYQNFFATGIIDPTKVTRSALENAASIASMLLTTEAVITDEPEDDDAGAAAAAAAMGGMGGGMPGMM